MIFHSNTYFLDTKQNSTNDLNIWMERYMSGKFHSNNSLSSNNLLTRKQLLLHCTLNLLLTRPESRERCNNTPVTSAFGAPRRKHTNTDVLEVIYHKQNFAMNDLFSRIHICQPKCPCHFKHCDYNMRLLFCFSVKESGSYV